MKNKMHKKSYSSKMFFTLLFGLSTLLSFAQPDPPPGEVPVDGNIFVLILVALISTFIFFLKKNQIVVEKK